MNPAFVTGAAGLPLSSRGFLGQSGAVATKLPAARAAAPRVAPVRMAAHLRKFIVGGNWKCNLTKGSIDELVATFNASPPLDPEEVEVVIAPAMIYVEHTRDLLRSDFSVCAQNCWTGAGGAYTGEVTADMIKDVGCDWVILGHSERRNLLLLEEGDSAIAGKARYAVDTGLKVIYCVGELLEEREAGTTLEVLTKQLKALSDKLSEDEWKNIVIAYEPVWAIGTGKVATPDQAEEVHCELRDWVAKNVNKDVADHLRIIYGGSVSGGNCNDLARLPDIDGFLVGGCSLKAEFLDIIKSHKVQEGEEVAA